MNVINLPPLAPSLIESTRAIGYSLEAAVADIIDNSIAAKADQISISFFPIGDPYVSILDNGEGMTEDALTIAMQYGSQSPLNTRDVTDLGRFGLGLKTASLSQCRVLTVVSKCNGTISARRWDIDFVQNTKQWSLLSLSEEEIEGIPNIDKLKGYSSGTLVVWQNLDRMEAGVIDFSLSMGRQIDLVRDHLSLVFHRYLDGEPGLKRIAITINGLNVEPQDPFLTPKSDMTMQAETIVVNGSVIKVQPYILPHISKMTASEIRAAGGKEGLRKLQGFYIYRNRRLLIWGTWFRMMRKGELSKLARVRVDIPNTLDELWTIDIKKSTAIPPEEVRSNLANIIDKIGEKSKAKFTRRGKIETGDASIHLWNRMKDRSGGYYYEINRDHPLVSLVRNEMGKKAKMLDALLNQVEKSLPLNQLYVDLNNDEQLINDQAQNEAQIEETLRNILSSTTEKNEKLAFIDQIESIPPYKDYKKAINKLRNEVQND